MDSSPSQAEVIYLKLIDRNCSLLIRLLRQGKDMDMDKLQMSLEDQLRTAAAQVHFCFLVEYERWNMHSS